MIKLNGQVLWYAPTSFTNTLKNYTTAKTDELTFSEDAQSLLQKANNMTMEFIKYQHLERWGTSEVQNIEYGESYIFPKIDGTNASLWLNENGELQAGSRKRHLTLDADNAGFYAWALEQKNLLEYLQANPKHRLFGEWLVPHSLKTYQDEAWKRFYVFDVAINKSEDEKLNSWESSIRYLHFKEYAPLLQSKGIDFLAPLNILTHASYDELIEELSKNVFLIKDNNGVGEGIVIKNYDFINKRGRQIWAKIVTSEFKEKHSPKPRSSENKIVEEEIAKEFVTTALVEKVYSKIEIEGGFTSQRIPQLLHTVFYDVVKEDAWTFIKKHKQPTINFKALQHFVFAEVKQKAPQLF